MRLSLALVAFAALLLAACGSLRTSRVEDGATVIEEAEEPTAKANTTNEEPKPRKGRSQEELEALGYDMGRTLYGKD